MGSKAFTVKLKSTLVMPSCLSSCKPAANPWATVKSGHCYIDRHCYAHNTPSPYAGFECTKCDAATNPLAWGPMDTTAACIIGGVCVAHGKHAQIRSGRSMVDDPCNMCNATHSTTGYSPVNGCKLPTPFAAGCYTDSGLSSTSIWEGMARTAGWTAPTCNLTTPSGRRLHEQVTVTHGAVWGPEMEHDEEE